MKKLILVRGLPGAGKSTVAKLFYTLDPGNTVHFEADMFFVKDGKYCFDASKIKDAHAWCQNVVGEYMKMSMPTIVVSNTFTQEWEMQPYINMAKRHGYQVTTLIVENRHGSESVHDVPAETLEKMKARFEVKL